MPDNPLAPSDRMLRQLNETTVLSPTEERDFQRWAKSNGISDANDPRSNYDYRGYWKENKGSRVRFGVDHFPDTYKQFTHPTFSIESKYAKPGEGGTWAGDTYVPQPRMKRSSSNENQAPNPLAPVGSALAEKLGLKMPPSIQPTPEQEGYWRFKQEAENEKLRAKRPRWLTNTADITSGLFKSLNPFAEAPKGGLTEGAPLEDKAQSIGQLVQNGLPLLGGVPFSKYLKEGKPLQLFTSSIHGIPHEINPASAYNYERDFIRGHTGSAAFGDRYQIPLKPESKNVLDLRDPNIDDMSQALASLDKGSKDSIILGYKTQKALGRGDEETRKYLADRLMDHFYNSEPPPGFDATRMATRGTGGPNREVFNFPVTGEAKVTTPEGIPIVKHEKINVIPWNPKEEGLPTGTLFDNDTANRPPGTGLDELNRLANEDNTVENLGGLTQDEYRPDVPIESSFEPEFDFEETIGKIFGDMGHPFTDIESQDRISRSFKHFKDQGLDDQDALTKALFENEGDTDRYLSWIDDMIAGQNPVPKNTPDNLKKLIKHERDYYSNPTQFEGEDILDGIDFQMHEGISTDSTIDEIEQAFKDGNIDIDTWAEDLKSAADREGHKYVVFDPKEDIGYKHMFSTEDEAKRYADDHGLEYGTVDEYIDETKRATAPRTPYEEIRHNVSYLLSNIDDEEEATNLALNSLLNAQGLSKEELSDLISSWAEATNPKFIVYDSVNKEARTFKNEKAARKFINDMDYPVDGRLFSDPEEFIKWLNTGNSND